MNLFLLSNVSRTHATAQVAWNTLSLVVPCFLSGCLHHVVSAGFILWINLGTWKLFGACWLVCVWQEQTKNIYSRTWHVYVDVYNMIWCCIINQLQRLWGSWSACYTNRIKIDYMDYLLKKEMTSQRKLAEGNNLYGIWIHVCSEWPMSLSNPSC